MQVVLLCDNYLCPVEEKSRFFLEISYNGSAYHGWQIQENAITVQEVLNKALRTLLRADIETVGCGRTDTGVHATEFFAHFDVANSKVESQKSKGEDQSAEPEIPNSKPEIPNSKSETLNSKDATRSPKPEIPNAESETRSAKPEIQNSGAESTYNLQPITYNSKFLRSLNSLLPYDIAVKRIIPVGENAHARFDATQRSYEYHIHFQKDPFKHDFSWLLRDKPDINLMNEAAQIMMEYRDFSCFSKSNTQTFTNNCVISRAEWVKTSGGIVFHISADRFLRNMVRAIVGTLIKVGRKEMQPADIRAVIESKNRSEAGTSVPACGLYLTKVVYPYIEPSDNG